MNIVFKIQVYEIKLVVSLWHLLPVLSSPFMTENRIFGRTSAVQRVGSKLTTLFQQKKTKGKFPKNT